MRLEIVRQIQQKELTLFFSSPIGYLFLGVFLALTLFAFFWIEAFFARNIADARPLFQSLPVLLILLTAALTMRMWSEERRSGTLEFVVTLPVSTWEFVLGKFFACWLLLLIALGLTLPLPITVALLGDLDWGPVFAGYLAAMLMGGAYLAVGLFVSSRTDSQIVSLIVTVLVLGVFYMLGSALITGLVGGPLRELLTSLGSGSRFVSIIRGVVDVRDLYFYLSVLIAFLAANVYVVERAKWAADGDAARHRRWRLGTGLLIGNLLLGNVWLSQVTALRFDLTQGNIYSISDATRNYLDRLSEPLLIRGYFSAKTHPLLAPLVPRLKDLLREYEVAGGGSVRVEIVDPASDPELENEANTKYGIRAVPFQVQDRYQASLVNSYLDVLVQYGDEYEVLGFRDFIEVKMRGEGDLDVQLKNPEFDITRSIKKVMYGFQGGSSVFANVADPVRFVGYVSRDDVLPEALVALKGELATALEALSAEGGDKFSAELVDPDAGDGQVAVEIAENFGFQPMAMSLFDEGQFYFYLTLQNDETVVQVPIPEGLSAEALEKAIEEGLKRFATGLLKSVALAAPTPPPPYMQQQGMPPTNAYSQLQSFLTSDFDVAETGLNDGTVPASAELLLVVDATTFSDEQRFAVDQFLMKGGTVVVSAGAYAAQLTQAGITATPRDTGLGEWLTHHGVTVGQSLVMDPQNSAFPVPVTRQVGGFSFQDLVMLDYPYFVDVRDEGLNEDAPMLTGLGQLTMSWASPLEVAAGEGVAVTELVRSSDGSWLSTSADVSPQFDESGLSAFVPEGPQASHLLAVALEGRFDSFYAGKDSPLLTSDETGEDGTDTGDEAGEADDGVGAITSVIERSPESARLIVFGSNDFLSDQTVQMVGSADGMLYTNAIQLVINLVDWALEDESLIGIRARGNFNRTLPGLDSGTQSLIEYGNYLLALLAVLAVLWFYRQRRRSRVASYGAWLAQPPHNEAGNTGGQRS